MQPPTAHNDTLTHAHTRSLSPSRSQFGEASAKPASRGMPRRKNGQALSPLPQRQGQHRAGMAHSKSTASIHRFRSAPRCLCQTTLPNHVLRLLTTSVLLFVVQPPRHSIAAATSATSTASTATAQAQQWLPDLRPSSQCQCGCPERSSRSL